MGPQGPSGAKGDRGDIGPRGLTGPAGSYTITYGNNQKTTGWTNIVGWWDNRNSFDVFPPAGKTMANLIAFIASISEIRWNGGVNGDDSTRCHWTNHGNKITVYVQNTEQHAAPGASWLAIWS
jgi:hypothetical protein